MMSGQPLYRPVRQKSQVGLEHGMPASIATRSPVGLKDAYVSDRTCETWSYEKQSIEMK